MGDMGDMYKAIKEHRQEQNREAAEDGPRILADRGFKFETHNAGQHLIVRRGAMVADFWPSTGKFIVRPSKAPGAPKTGKVGRGVFNLIKVMAGG